MEAWDSLVVVPLVVVVFPVALPVVIVRFFWLRLTDWLDCRRLRRRCDWQRPIEMGSMSGQVCFRPVGDRQRIV